MSDRIPPQTPDPLPPPPIEPPQMEPPPLAAAPVEPPPVELLPLTCPACASVFQVATTLLGCRVACPACQALVMATVTEPAQSPTVPPPPEPPPFSLHEAITESPAKAPPPAAAKIELSHKDRARRRLVRNVVLWILCLAILVAVLWLMR